MAAAAQKTARPPTLAVLAGWLVFAVANAQRIAVVPFFNDLRRLFHIDYTAAGGLLSAYLLGYVLTQIPAGLAADNLPTRRVIVAGLAEMIAGGVSMFLGGYTAARAVAEAYYYQVGIERQEIENEPEEERSEVRRMYRDRGFRDPLLDSIVRHITADNERWLHVMVRDELGSPPEEGPSAWQSGLAVGLAFMLGALVPVLPFLGHVPSASLLAAGLSLCALAVTGALRSRYSEKSAWRSAGEMVFVGVIGTLVGLVVGRALQRVS